MRKSKDATIEDLLYSNKNFTTVEEELAQYGDIFKLLIGNHEENCKILNSEEQSNDEEHLEDVHWKMLIFKHKVQNWRRVQHLADDLLHKERKEFLSTVQTR